MTSLIHEITIGYMRGWIFTPLAGKRPVLDRWQVQHRPTLEQCIAWATPGSDRQGNVGIRCGRYSGIAVIDIEATSPMSPTDYPRTWTVRTGGGGWHLYYRCDRPVPNSCGTLARQVDVRGDGGQVVFVGGRHPDTGRLYEWWSKPAPQPAEFPYHLLPQPPRPPMNQPPARRAVMPQNVGDVERRAMAYMARVAPAVSGQGGHDQTFRVACTCWRFGLDEAAVWRVMRAYSERCQPPWSDRELAHKIRSAREVTAREGRFGEKLKE